jgi:hypothetical protein
LYRPFNDCWRTIGDELASELEDDELASELIDVDDHEVAEPGLKLHREWLTGRLRWLVNVAGFSIGLVAVIFCGQATGAATVLSFGAVACTLV